MLRRHLDHAINDAIQQDNFEPLTTEFLFGFTTTVTTILLILILVLMIFGYVTKQTILRVIYEDIHEYRYILPLYYNKNERNQMKKDKYDNEEITVRPHIDFIVPSIHTDYTVLNTPVSPAISLDSVSSIKRRISPAKLQEDN